MKYRKRSFLLPLLLALLLSACTRRQVDAPGEPAQPPIPAVTPAPAAAPQPESVPEELLGVRISELMPDNESPEYDFRDWIELYNGGSETVNLQGCGLSDKENKPFEWTFGDVELAPGEYLVLPCRAADDPASPDLSLSKTGEALYLTAPNGAAIHAVSYGDTEENHSVCFDGEEAHTTLYATPGAANTYENWAAAQENARCESPLQINEVMVANYSLLAQPGWKYPDWVELKNCSDQPVYLKDYALSDKADRNGSFVLPDITLSPGQVWVTLCSTEEGDYYYTNTGFSLDSLSESLYLLDAEGQCVDYVYLCGLTTGGSMGRKSGENGFFYYTAPTPGWENEGECARSRTGEPTADVPSGRYEEQGSITVTLSGEGEIYYTLDGSVPTAEDSLYTEPLTISESCVLRAVSFAEGRLPGRVLSCHYLFEPDEPMEIVSIAADPVEFRIFYGNVDAEAEVGAHMAFLGADGSFGEDCGLALHGKTSLKAIYKQRSLKISFRGRYGASPVTFPLFGEEEDHHALIVRTGMSKQHWLLADELFSQLAREFSEELIVMGNRFVSVYVNGEYAGFYMLRAHHNEDFFAERWNVSKDSVESYRPLTISAELEELFVRIAGGEFNDPESFKELEQKMALTELADWMIIEAYSGNQDLKTNIKFVRSKEYDGKWHVVLFDMDNSFLGTAGLENFCAMTANIPECMKDAFAALLDCPGFREILLERLTAALTSSLTKEHTLEVLDNMCALYGDEIRRSQRVNLVASEQWENGINELRGNINALDMPAIMRESAEKLLKLTPEEAARLIPEDAGGAEA